MRAKIRAEVEVEMATRIQEVEDRMTQKMESTYWLFLSKESFRIKRTALVVIESARNLKTKQSGGETPRKNKTPIKFGHFESSSTRRVLNCKSDNVKDCLDETQPFCDLWSDVKKAAEENVRLSTGKQTHPFFSICKATKRLSDTKHAEKSETSSWHSLEGDYCISLPPVHVFETVKDDVAVPNWKKWNFLETGYQEIDGYCSAEISSFFDVSTESLILGSSCGKETRLDTLLVDEKIDGTYMPTNSSKISCERLSKEQLSSQIEKGSVADNELDQNMMYKERKVRSKAVDTHEGHQGFLGILGGFVIGIFI